MIYKDLISLAFYKRVYNAIFIKKLLGSVIYRRLLIIYAVLLARPIFRRFNLLILGLGLKGIGISNGYTSYTSGEQPLSLKLLKDCDFADSVVLDIGANEGKFTEQIVLQLKNVRVIAFEPNPFAFKRLTDRFADNSRVILRNCAVSDTTGSIKLYDHRDEEGSCYASLSKEVIEVLLETISKGQSREFDVLSVTLDDENIKGNVELIKIDVEGFELSVLKGAKNTIDKLRPKHIILEFNQLSITNRVFLKDIIDFLKGYKVYRILPGGRLLTLNNPYDVVTHEIFNYQNILFSRDN